MSETFVDYYAVLEVSPDATQEQIRTAYKKAALKSHPDRVPSDSPERPARTKKFQRINDAYYTLSDPTRRRDYDVTRQFNTGHSGHTFDDDEEETAQPKTGGGFNPWNFFGGGAKGTAQGEKFSNEQFGSVFEEMMRDANLAEEEGEGSNRTTRPNGRFWTIVGSVSGFGLGVIIGNITGGIAGAAAGAKLGGIRDAKGKSVYSVYQELPQGDKSRLLTELASKLFASALSG